MKVLYISDPVLVGGATKSLKELTTYLATYYNLDITICFSEENEIASELELYGIKCIYDNHMAAMEVEPNLPNLYRFYRRLIKRKLVFAINTRKSIKKIESQIDVSEYDLIHTNSARNIIGCILAKKYHIPHIMHIREFGKEDFNCWYLKSNYFSYLNNGVTRFIAISNAVKNSWGEKGILDNKISVVYNGIAFNDDRKITLSLTEESLKMVILGGICEAKGQWQIIEAMGLLEAGIRDNIFLDMYGWADKEYLDEIKARCVELGISNQVNYCGVINSAFDVLHNYHVGLMCSKSEGFGRVTAEYMLAGLGIIATNAGANSELIESSVTGLMYPLNDIRTLSDRITEFYYNRDVLRECGNNAKKKALESYVINIMAKQIFDIYHTVIK